MPLTSFFVATLALNLAPGPDMTYVAARSLGQGRRAGLISALGISAGCLVHIVAAAAAWQFCCGHGRARTRSSAWRAPRI
jgi:threonine/homoserine/homoserine lactone efflux protein